MDKQWKLVPIERSYDMRIKALIAFNAAEKGGEDRDDALGAAFRAMLDATPQPPSASDERERYVKWLTETYPTIHTAEDAERWWSQEHISALAWEAGAALAPSPGVDAAEQKPVAYLIDWPDEPELGRYFAEEPTDTGRCRALVLAESAPSPAASATERKATTHRTLHEQIHDAQAEVAAWEPDRREAVVRQGPRDDHPPSRDCMCATCRPLFDNGADDPVQRYDTRGGGNE